MALLALLTPEACYLAWCGCGEESRHPGRRGKADRPDGLAPLDALQQHEDRHVVRERVAGLKGPD